MCSAFCFLFSHPGRFWRPGCRRWWGSGPAAGWRCGAAYDELDGDVALGGGAAVEYGEEGLHAAFAEEFGVEADGRQLGVDGGGEGEVVEAGDGEVVGDAQAEAADGLVGAGGEFVVVADESGGVGAGAGEGGRGGLLGALDGDGGVDGAYVGVRDGGEPCGEFVGAYGEGPGGDVGGEVEEAAVAEAEEVVGDLAYAVGDVEVDGGGAEAAVGVAVEHDEGELVAADGGEGVGGHGGGEDAVEGGLGGVEGVSGGADAFGEG